MTDSEHNYVVSLTWDGNTGQGTASYTAYERLYRIACAGKPDLAGTADPAFRGDPGKHNPEDLFLAAISACHMLFYLSLCAKHGIRVLAYEDAAHGRMSTAAGGGGKFEEVRLNPAVTLAAGSDEELAVRLHDRAHELCFIANSCSVPIHHECVVKQAQP